MNKILMAIFGLLLSITVNAAPHKGGGAKTGIGFDSLVNVRSLGRAAEIDSEPIIEVYAALTPRDTSAKFGPTIRKWIADVRAGTEVVLPFGEVPTGDTMYSSVPNGTKAPWYAFVYSESDPMFAGVLTPGGSEHGYTTAYLGHIKAQPGKKVRLSMISAFSFNSNDGGTSNGSLYEYRTVTNPAYTDLAVGFNGNDPITSGSGDQECDEIFVVFWNYPYNGGGSQQGLDEVEQYVKSILNFSETFTLYAAGFQANRTVETAPGPIMTVSLSPTQFTVNARVSGLLQTSVDLVTWVDYSQVMAGFQWVDDISVLGDLKFFRLVTR